MERPVAGAVIDTGIVDASDIEQLRQWGLFTGEDAAPGKYKTAVEVINCIREALDSGETVELRRTDLDLAKEWLKDHRKGRLYMVPTGSTKPVSISIDYHKTRMGDYVIPWTSDSIFNLMVAETTYLVVDGKKIHFSDVEELFYGDSKAFMLCAPSRV